MKLRLSLLFCILIVAASAFFVFSGALHYGFVWDDRELLFTGEAVNSSPAWKRIFLSSTDRLYRPARTISFACDHSTGSGAAFTYHLTNLLLHALTSILVFMLVFELSSSIYPSLFSALLFAVHPLHAEVVCWISGGRADLLSAFFGLIALFYYIRSRGANKYSFVYFLLSLISFCVALLSKENAVIIPLLILCYALLEKSSRRAGRRVIAVIPYFFILAAYIWLRFSVFGETRQMFGYHGGSLRSTLLTMSTVWSSYIRDIFMPTHLCPVYTVSIQQSFSTLVIFGIVFIIAASIVSIVALFRKKLWGFGIAWFLVSLLPVSNIIPINALKADRFMYFPSIGIFIIMGDLFHCLFFRSNRGEKNKSIAAASFLAVTSFSVILMAILTIRTVPAWKSNYSLWSHAVHCAPASWGAFNNLGAESFRLGRTDEAIAALKKASHLNPNGETIYNNLADVYGNAGNYRLALENLKICARLNPESAETYYKIGFALAKLGELQEAKDNYETALAKSGDSIQLRAVLQNALRRLNEK